MTTVETKLFEMDTKKEYSYEEITDMLKGINCPVNKFLTEVRKIVKLKSSSPLWYGFSDQLLSKNEKLKNKDQYARIVGEYQTARNGKEYNFHCAPTTRKYYVYHMMNIEIV